jgi:ATP-binding cassette subfamily B protein
VDDNIAKAGFRQALRTLPAAARVVLSKKFNDGQDLSGGQWQRMGIARGIYRDAAVLIADEPAAALDARAEARVSPGCSTPARAATGRRTTVLVTHRLANVGEHRPHSGTGQGNARRAGHARGTDGGAGLYRELFEIQAGAYRAAAGRVDGG